MKRSTVVAGVAILLGGSALAAIGTREGTPGAGPVQALPKLVASEGCRASDAAAETRRSKPQPVGLRVDRRDELAALGPLAVAWAEDVCGENWSRGEPLDAAAQAIARAVGVRHPEMIRVVLVDALPVPTDPALHAAAVRTGLVRPGMIGLTLGYAVFVRRGFASPRILAHEFRHVYQYERATSIAAFVPEYLREITEMGYAGAPLEIDARDHEPAA